VKKVLWVVLALLLIGVGYALSQAQQNHCRFALVIAHNEEMGLLVLGLGQPLAPSVSIARPIEPFWPGVMICMRPPTPEEAAMRDSVP
jgi:hypothetical protein